MKTRSSKLSRFSVLLALTVWSAGPPALAKDAPILEIALYPGIRVTGEVGTTCVIESTTDVEGGFWLTRGWLELATPTTIWMDPVPTDSPRRVYRAVRVTKPVIQAPANMVWIPPGRFVMGSPEDERGRGEAEGPQTRVTLTKAFWMGKYEVTQREYLAVMGNNPSYFQPPQYPEDRERPVEQVSWEDAVAYCQKLTEQERVAGRLPTGYVHRLPTEAEWEYACRAGTTTRFSFGDALECDDYVERCALLDSYVCWTGNNETEGTERFGTQRVGQKLPNPWGLHDIHGNVMEWCRDWRSDQLPGGMVVDPGGPPEGSWRVIRGSMWAYFAYYCRSADRNLVRPTMMYISTGFRVVLAPGQP